MEWNGKGTHIAHLDTLGIFSLPWYGYMGQGYLDPPMVIVLLLSLVKIVVLRGS